MQINPKVKRQLKLQHWIFLVLLATIVCSLAWLSIRYDAQFDWTQNKSNTPSETTLNLLATIDEPVTLRAFVSAGNSQDTKHIEGVVNAFQRHSKYITLEFIDPLKKPEITRKYDIHSEGELIVEYQQRTQRLTYVDEQSLINAIQRLLRNESSWISFLEGHGERDPNNRGNFDYSTLRQQLEEKGFNVRSFNFAESTDIPANTKTLVIADPSKNLLAGEIQKIQDYIDAGNNLLWLAEPSNRGKLEELSEQLGVEFTPGMVVDPNSQILGISDARFVMIPEYPIHPITQNFTTLTLFPTASAIEYIETEDWEANVFLETLPRSWVETEEISDEEITMDSGVDIPGPVTIGLALTRFPNTGNPNTEEPSELGPDETDTPTETQQRVIVIGDADFMADAYIGQGGNLDLAINIFNWLSRSDNFLNIPARTLKDQQLNLSRGIQIFIAVLFLVLLPGALISSGLLIWIRRRKN